MRWFGETWNAKFCRRALHVATPVGRICAGCERPIELTDQGFIAEIADLGGGPAPFHRMCFYDSLGIKMTVHILRYGLPLCRFSVEVPNKWPNGHLWAPTRAGATCEHCKREYDVQHER
jgi:hypothetical protein